jgi:hypothetical protein
VSLEYTNKQLTFYHGERSVSYFLSNAEVPHESEFPCFTKQLLADEPTKIAAVVLSKLHRNKTVFARKCTIKKISNEVKDLFLNEHHMMGATKSAYNFGLFYHNELVAVATFSKGRKMDRLPSHLRSYELIRFCTKFGVTVSGGLSRLVVHFCTLRQAGDVMTYINRQYGNERSFISAGFIKVKENDTDYFPQNKTESSSRNIKLIFVPNDLNEL